MGIHLYKRFICGVALSGVLTAAAFAQQGMSPADSLRPFAKAAPKAYFAEPTAANPSSVAAITPASLPDAPSALLEAASSIEPQAPAAVLYQHAKVAPRLEMYIQPGFTGQPLTAKGKLEIGLRDLYRPGSFLAIFASAGYSQLENSTPNYGSDTRAFGQRLGATAIRDTTGGIFTAGVFAPLLHQDPRYYIEGPRHNIVHRTLYAITRPLVTRTDQGNYTINGALLAGNAAASLLTAAYYPQANRNVHDVASIYGTSIGGSALGFFVDEFVDGFLQSLHLEGR